VSIGRKARVVAAHHGARDGRLDPLRPVAEDAAAQEGEHREAAAVRLRLVEGGAQQHRLVARREWVVGGGWRGVWWVVGGGGELE
jgi:hypothetical protein